MEHISHASSQSQHATQASFNKGALGTHDEDVGTHIGILSIDTGGRDHPDLLLIFIEYDRVGIDALSDDLEAGFVSDAIAVSKG